MALTGKQRAFINEYLICWNATEAARRAGYAEKYLNTNANKLLQNTTIMAEIQRRIEEMTMGADEALMRLTEQARAAYSAYILPRGTINLETMVTDGKAHLIKKIKETKYGREVEFYDAQAALQLIGKHHGLFSDMQLNIDMSTLSYEQLERIAAGENPLNVLAISGQGGDGEAAETTSDTTESPGTVSD